MNSFKVFGLVRNYQLMRHFKRHLMTTDVKWFSLTPNLCTESKNPINEFEDRVTRLLSESVNPSSPLKSLIDRWISKSWISYAGESTKNLQIKERQSTTPLKDGMFRMAFDLPGFKSEDIQAVICNNKLYVEAKKDETTTDGSKAWREFSFECDVAENLKPNTVTASIDSEGLLVVEGQVLKESLTGVKKPEKTQQKEAK